MKRYKVQWHYTSALGTLARNAEVELSDEDAAAFNRDSPGVLVEVRPPAPAPAPKAQTMGAKNRGKPAASKDR